jgi:transcriptional regulator with PAS, ATPase and Fis domain
MTSAAVAESLESLHAVEHEDVAARCAVTTLITASTSTEVEHLARRIHTASSRGACSFVHAAFSKRLSYRSRRS